MGIGRSKKKPQTRPQKKKNHNPLRNPSGSYQDGTGTRHQCLQDMCITPQTESEHVVCIRMQTTFFPPPGLVHTVAQTWLSYWPHADTAEAIHRKDPLATHLIYMPCFRRLRFEHSSLQKQDCLQRNSKPIAQQRDAWRPGSVRSECAQPYSLIKSSTSGPYLWELSDSKY